ncbi:hypothetical protein [Curtobacterium sp. 9128]|uniref:hypothetical protein n=1 Tax=Curtobacterium sp. 9128 TaxID=1793722 RepID=UPI002481DD2B|nr:hypothetical protein [Curtobacterium sp. 9128]
MLVRDPGLLEAALTRAATTIDGRDACPTLVFLGVNGRTLTMSDEFIVAITEGRLDDVGPIAAELVDHAAER